ncbi:MAG: nucleotidyltransferase family protein [Bacillota bacterium]
MEAIILAGGFGTRLSHVISDVPKPMAPVNNRPFLEYILDYLLEYNFNKIILAVGYKNEVIKEYFQNSYKGISIIYSTEDTPLGTGGAIKKGMEYCNDNDIFILNGDTFFDVNLFDMSQFHKNNKSTLTIAVKTMVNYDRYGSVIVENERIVEFREKMKTGKGKINGGIYLVNKNIFNTIPNISFYISFSFEEKILESSKHDIFAFESNGYFIDIGIPEDYYKAQKDFLK